MSDPEEAAPYQVAVGKDFEATWADGHVTVAVTKGADVVSVTVDGPNFSVRGLKVGDAELSVRTVDGSPVTVPSDPPVPQSTTPATIPISVVAAS
ncbi:MAG: hypothetical protein F4X99_03280 [Gammaproteobacteria bacterium]|nr:hypothetical protein [Gammaproteobacteria bacterium]